MSKLLKKYFIPYGGDTGGSGKSRNASLFASLFRSRPGISTALADGDPLNKSTYDSYSQRDASGNKIPSKDNDILIGCRMIESTDATAASNEIFRVFEKVQPDVFLVDGAAASESDFSKTISNNSEPEEFVETLEELGYSLNLATTLLPKTKGKKRNEAVESLQRLFDLYKDIPTVHFIVSLSFWEGDVMDNESDENFKYWFKHELREQLVATGRYHEYKMVTLPDEVNTVTSQYEVPLSKFADADFCAEAEISIRVRNAIRKFLSLFEMQMQADPYLREMFRLPDPEAVEG